MLSELHQGIHPFFLRTVPGVPLTAELYEYQVVEGTYHLAMRYLISRDRLGSVYLGVCSRAAPFGEPTPPLAVVCIWEVPTKQMKLRVAGGEEQVEGGPGSIFPAESQIPVILDRTTPPTSHLGYSLYGVEGHPHLRYCPSLEIAVSYTDESIKRGRVFIIQAVTPGEPSLEPYGLHAVTK
jgi:hypothetical protein